MHPKLGLNIVVTNVCLNPCNHNKNYNYNKCCKHKKIANAANIVNSTKMVNAIKIIKTLKMVNATKIVDTIEIEKPVKCCTNKSNQCQMKHIASNNQKKARN